MLGKERIRAAVSGAPVDRLPFMPITMMFAADMIGRSYRDYATDFRVLVEGQIAVSEAFGADYVSCISDPTREAGDCGAPINFFDDSPPSIDEENALLAEKGRLGSLKIPRPEEGRRMNDRLCAASLFAEKVGEEKLIEGWIEGPCAEAADLRGINRLMLDFYDDPAFVNDLLDFATEMEIEFARAQVSHGVDLIGIGDAAASLVGPAIYEEFIWPREKRMVDAVHEMGAMVRMHICGNTNALVTGLGKLGCEIVDLDYMVSIEAARAAMGPDQVLLGNIDPVNVLMKGNPATIRSALEECRRQAGDRYIVGAGCEVPRGTPGENLEAMREFAESQKG